jgi:hypothetical protein
MKSIKIGFVDFWPDFNKENNYFIQILRNSYDVTVTDGIDEVEYLFYSCFGYEHIRYNCIKIFYTGENLIPDFNLCDYAIGFEDMQYGDRYIRLPLYMVAYREYYAHMMEIRGRIQPRNKFCSFVVSNKNIADPTRKELFDKLNSYKKVDSGGRYLNNIGKPEGVEDKQEFLEHYKFNLAVENSSHLGYCTEKIIQAFAAGAIPIYWGDPAVGKYFNEKAFVNCHNYSSFDDVIERVAEIDNNYDKYISMLNEPIFINNHQKIEYYDKMFEKWVCNIIEQPLVKARRTCRYGAEMNYINQICKWLECEEKCRVIESGKIIENKSALKRLKDFIYNVWQNRRKLYET